MQITILEMNNMNKYELTQKINKWLDSFDTEDEFKTDHFRDSFNISWMGGKVGSNEDHFGYNNWVKLPKDERW